MQVAEMFEECEGDIEINSWKSKWNCTQIKLKSVQLKYETYETSKIQWTMNPLLPNQKKNRMIDLEKNIV